MIITLFELFNIRFICVASLLLLSLNCRFACIIGLILRAWEKQYTHMDTEAFTNAVTGDDLHSICVADLMAGFLHLLRRLRAPPPIDRLASPIAAMRYCPSFVAQVLYCATGGRTAGHLQFPSSPPLLSSCSVNGQSTRLSRRICFFMGI